MRAWIEQGAELEKRLASHRKVRDRLRQSAGLLPYTEVDRAADLEAHAAGREQPRLRDERDQTTAALAGESRHLDALVHERLTWRFASSAEQFQHDTSAKLVEDLTAFLDPDPKKGLLSDVRGRLAFALSVEKETIGRYETEWANAIRSIADGSDCPRYGGLRIKPQLGLIPIAKDPASGLWEFAHLQTTAPGSDPIPARGPDGRLMVTESMGIVFVLLPGGTFRMGAVKPTAGQTPTEPNVDPEAEEHEAPLTEVTLDPFFISKYEMTQGQWLRVVGKNPSCFDPGMNIGGTTFDRRHPVEQASFRSFDSWLGRLGLILPTEAQWEYAARGGTTTPRWTGIGKNGLDKAANLADRFSEEYDGPSNRKYELWSDGYTMHAPVGSFAPNPFGLHDMLGNVWEWCRDWYSVYELKPCPGDGLRRGSDARNHMMRGGCFRNDASDARSAQRFSNPPDYIRSTIGVRPARPCRQD